jgi:hypothetical protein
MSFGYKDIVAAFQSIGRGDPSSALMEVFGNNLLKLLQFLDAKIQFARKEQVLDTTIAELETPDAITADAQAMDETEDAITSDLSQAVDRLAGNLGITRRPAVGSIGLVVILRSSPVTRPILVAAGKRFYSSTLDQEYAVSETINLTSMTYDPILGKFTASIPVQSVNTGLATVAAIGQITTIRDSITDIEGVTNTQPIVGGRDVESDRDLAARAKTALSANNIATKSGLRLLLLGLDSIKDVSIVGAGDPLMARDLGDGGSVDAYITDPIPVQVTETAITGVNLFGTGPYYFTPSRQPVVNDVNLVAPIASTIHKDGTVYAGSIRAKDIIEFPTNVNGQAIDFFVNNNVLQTQEFMDADERDILGSDVLIKEAVTVLVYATFRIVVLSGFSRSTVQTNVLNAITQKISTLGIGVSLEQSDVVRVAVDTPGVDRVDLPMTRFDRGTVDVLNVIDAGGNEVLRVGAVIVNL